MSPSTSPYRRHRFPAKIIQSLELKSVSLRILNLGMDRQTPTGKLMLTVLVGLAQFELEMRLERQRERVARKRRQQASIRAENRLRLIYVKR
jgi:DNA invertase Pin-like site-specific DNA recombinase